VNLTGLLNTEINSTEELETRVNRVTGTLVEAFHEACPLKKVRTKGPIHNYWTPQLSELRKDARRLQRWAQARGFPEEDNERFKAARHAFEYSLRAAKELSFHTYCEEIRSLLSAARLYRVLAGGKTIRLGSVELPDGSLTPGARETMDHLLKQHFPRDPNREPADDYDHTPVETPLLQEVANDNLVKRVLGSFGPYKAAGPDEIFPAMLTVGREILTPVLGTILRACLRFGYIPTSWRRTRAVFIPKPAKDSYQRTISWRPISLTSFLLKTLERLIDRHLRTSTLERRLKRAGQCAYLRGASTELALHRFVNQAEKALRNQEYGLAVLLDIEGAFSHATFRSMINGMRREGLNECCIRTVRHMLETRTVCTGLMGETAEQNVERGCPQGGVLSPLLWILLVGEILDILGRDFPQLMSQAFADDLGILQWGMDLPTVTNIVQQALNSVLSGANAPT